MIALSAIFEEWLCDDNWTFASRLNFKESSKF